MSPTVLLVASLHQEEKVDCRSQMMLLTGESTNLHLHSKHICLLYFPCYLPIIYLPHIIFLGFRWRWYLSTSSSQFFELVIPAFLPSTYDIYILINFCFVFLLLICLLLLAPWQELRKIKRYFFLHLKFVIKSVLWCAFFRLLISFTNLTLGGPSYWT